MGIPINGQTPMSLYNHGDGSRLNYRRPLYVTVGELWTWCSVISTDQSDDNPYKDALEKLEDAMAQIDMLWDGSLSYNDPRTQATVYLPKYLNDGDAYDIFLYDNNTRYIGWPLFPLIEQYSKYNNREWYQVLTIFCGKVKRAIREIGWEYIRKLKAQSMTYNPYDDYEIHTREEGASAPYVKIEVPQGQDPYTKGKITNWNEFGDGARKYKSESEIDGANPITTTNETTTFDSTALRNLDKSTQRGKTTNTNEIPNSGYFKNYDENGNKGTPMADIVKKEWDLANPMGEIFDEFMKKIYNKTLLAYWPGA